MPRHTVVKMSIGPARIVDPGRAASLASLQESETELGISYLQVYLELIQVVERMDKLNDRAHAYKASVVTAGNVGRKPQRCHITQY